MTASRYCSYISLDYTVRSWSLPLSTCNRSPTVISMVAVCPANNFSLPTSKTHSETTKYQRRNICQLTCQACSDSRSRGISICGSPSSQCMLPTQIRFLIHHVPFTADNATSSSRFVIVHESFHEAKDSFILCMCGCLQVKSSLQVDRGTSSIQTPCLYSSKTASWPDCSAGLGI